MTERQLGAKELLAVTATIEPLVTATEAAINALPAQLRGPALGSLTLTLVGAIATAGYGVARLKNIRDLAASLVAGESMKAVEIPGVSLKRRDPPEADPQPSPGFGAVTPEDVPDLEDAARAMQVDGAHERIMAAVISEWTQMEEGNVQADFTFTLVASLVEALIEASPDMNVTARVVLGFVDSALRDKGTDLDTVLETEVETEDGTTGAAAVPAGTTKH